MNEKPKVIVVFFGLNRGISISSDSIVENIINENKDYIQYKIVSLNLLERISNPRNGEDNVIVDKNESLLIEADTYLLKKQNNDDVEQYLQFSKIHGDNYNNNWISISGMLHQFLSLKRAWSYIQSNLCYEGNLFLFLRSDLVYLDKMNIDNIIQKFQGSGNIAIPNWHHFNGLNDRFALCDLKAATIYANRLDWVAEYSLKHKLYPEGLLAYCIEKFMCKIYNLPVRAKRVRAGNVIREEDFSVCQRNLTSDPKLMKQLYFQSA